MKGAFLAAATLPTVKTPCAPKRLGQLFRLIQNNDGTWSAKLTSRMERRFDSLYYGWSKNPQTVPAYRAILALLEVASDFNGAGIVDVDELSLPFSSPRGNSAKPDEQKQFLRAQAIAFTFYAVQNLAPLFAAIKGADAKTIKATCNRAKKVMENVIDKLADPLPQKSDDREKAIHVSELKCSIPIAAYAIHVAQRLAGELQKLPSMAEVRNEILKRDSTLESSSRGFWSSVWKDAGLQSLPKGKPVFSRQKGQMDRVRTKFRKSP